MYHREQDGVNWKYYDNLPETNDVMYDISDNEYYIRWSYTQRYYSYDKAQPSVPTNVSITDVSYNHGISPYKYFDFTQYGKIYERNKCNFYMNIRNIRTIRVNFIKI